MRWGVGLRALGVRVWVLEIVGQDFNVQGVVLIACCCVLRVQGSGFGVEGLELEGWGLGFRVWG